MKTKINSGIACQQSRGKAKLLIIFTLMLGSACSDHFKSGSDSTTKQAATPKDKKLEEKLSEIQHTSTDIKTGSKPTKDETVAFAKEKGILSDIVDVTNIGIKNLSDYKGREQSCVYFPKGSSYVCAENGDILVDATLPTSEWGPHIRNVISQPHLRLDEIKPNADVKVCSATISVLWWQEPICSGSVATAIASCNVASVTGEPTAAGTCGGSIASASLSCGVSLAAMFGMIRSCFGL